MPLGNDDISMQGIATSGSLSDDNISLQTIYTTFVNGDATGNFALDDMGNKDYPTVATNAASSVTSTSMTCNGTISSDGNVHGDITQRGFYFGTNSNYASNTKVNAGGTAIAAYTLARTSLSAATTYYITAYAINALGERQGSTVSQATSVALTSFTYAATSPPSTDAEAACEINPDEGVGANATGYHDGSGTFPANGDSVYTNSGGTSALSNGYYQISVPEGKSTTLQSFQIVSGDLNGDPADC